MRRVALLALPLLAACAQQPVTPLEAARICEERARAAQAPSGSARIGATSRGEVSTGISIGVTGDFLRGRDPYAVYEECVFDRTGAAPVRPPRLR